MLKCHHKRHHQNKMLTKINEFHITDNRIYDLQYTQGMFANLIRLKLTQLELLKIHKALHTMHMVELSHKFEKLIEAVDNDTGQKTRYDRKLPTKNNGIRIKEWQSVSDV